MVFYLVANGEIVGNSSTHADALPEGWQCIEGPDFSDPYFDGEKILAKPTRPSLAHSWNSQTYQWDAPPQPEPAIAENWNGFLNDIRGSEVFARIYQASTQSLRANSAYTLLSATLSSTHNLQDLQWAISELREGLRESIGDFTGEELTYINESLIKNRFTLQVEFEQ